MSKLGQLSMVLGLLGLLLIAAMMSGLIRSERWTISNLEVSAEYQRVSAEQIRTTIANSAERSFFRLNTAQIQQQLMDIPWVRKVQVSKRWPDTLKVKVWEHQAVAVWNQETLLNESGEIFQVHAIDSMRHLPLLVGPADNAQQMLSDYQRLNQLLVPTGVEIARADMSERGGWVLVLRNGLEVVLGSEKMDARLLRFADTWGALLKKSGRLPESVDLRYTNGYVVRWREQQLPVDIEGEVVS